MNGNSKSEKVDAFIRLRVKREIQELAFQNPVYAETLRMIVERLAIGIAYECVSGYNLRELDDIMHWRKPKDVE